MNEYILKSHLIVKKNVKIEFKTKLNKNLYRQLQKNET